MLKFKAHLLTQGMHGMVSQVEGLAKGLNLNFKHQTVKLKPIWNFIPPKFTPISENLLTEKFICDSKVIISCGRKSVIHSIALKRKFKNKIFNIHIQDPKVSLKNFDLIVCPEHDSIKGENVINTKGAIHYLTQREIGKKSEYIKLPPVLIINANNAGQSKRYIPIGLSSLISSKNACALFMGIRKPP